MGKIIIPKKDLLGVKGVDKTVNDMLASSGAKKQLTKREELAFEDAIYKARRGGLTRKEARPIIAEMAFKKKNFSAAERLRKAMGMRSPRKSDLEGLVDKGESSRDEKIQERIREQKMREQESRDQKIERRRAVADRISENFSDAKIDREKDFLKGQLGTPGISSGGSGAPDVRPVRPSKLF